jgi:hypothetical protein
MRTLCIFAAAAFSAAAFAQNAPKVGGKPLVQVKPKTTAGCKMVGTVRGTKLWAGECAPETGTTPADGTLSSEDKSAGPDQSGSK